MNISLMRSLHYSTFEFVSTVKCEMFYRTKTNMCIRQCGYKIWRTNCSHLSPKNYTKWQLCSLVYKQSDVSHLCYTVK